LAHFFRLFLNNHQVGADIRPRGRARNNNNNQSTNNNDDNNNESKNENNKNETS
jgi:hypothetical protein